VFGIALHSGSGVHLTGTNTKIDSVDTGKIDGSGHVDFVIESLPLTPGDYELTVAVNDEFVQHVYDRHDRAWRLAVREGTSLAPEGLMDLRGRWSLSPAE
jgi:ABC-2 type transport system ATP-binding protein/lipopolysaccharide transport system ATP-binding protein